MLSTLKVVTALIFASIIIYFIYQYKTFHFLETDKYSSSFSQFISLKGTDEYVISELKTAEKFEDHWVKKYLIQELLLPVLMLRFQWWRVLNIMSNWVN